MSPQQLSQRLGEGLAHHEAGRLDRAEAIYRQLASQAPRTAVIFELWGRLAEQQGRLEDATRHYRMALQLEPKSVPRAVQLAGAMIAAGRIPDAERVVRKLTQDLPVSADAWSALGYVLKLQARLPEALACHEKAVALNPRFVEGWYHYGLILSVLGRNIQALEKHERALTLNPKFVHARYGRAQVLHKSYRSEEAIADYDAYLKANPGDLEARSYRLFALQGLENVSRERLFAEHRAYGESVERGPAVLPGYDYDPERRLRVAIHSPDLRTHSCAFFLEPLLEGLDPARFELCLYHDHFVEDAVTARFKAKAWVWRNFVAQPASVFERTVRADKPDILIDLTGHVGNTVRLPSLAKRLAPVQISYLGYPDTTGLRTMDFRFTDAVADPVGEADLFATEQLVRFAPVAWTYRPPAEAPEPPPLPATIERAFTFGCFNSPTKFTETGFRAWARILEQVPNSRLLLKGMDFEEEGIRRMILARLATQGITEDRVELLPRTDTTAQHLAQYARMDLALDTFPYNGTTTTCEALWMGRPVVALKGDRHAARVGASLLQSIDRPRWVAESVDEYVRIAVGLAQDRTTLARESAALRGAMRLSPLMDYRAQAERFGSALRECWRAKASSAARA